MKGLAKLLSPLGVSTKTQQAGVANKDATDTCSELYSEFLEELSKNDVNKQFRAAARLIANHSYEESLAAYKKLQKLHTDRRAICEVKIGMVFLFLEEYKSAFDSFLAAKVHGADDEESERHIWDACTGILSKNVSNQQKTECLELYMRLFPKGRHTEEARALTQVAV